MTSEYRGELSCLTVIENCHKGVRVARGWRGVAFWCPRVVDACYRRISLTNAIDEYEFCGRMLSRNVIEECRRQMSSTNVVNEC